MLICSFYANERPVVWLFFVRAITLGKPAGLGNRSSGGMLIVGR
jgi:hypothetical protein